VLSERTHQYARRLTPALLGIDALYRAESEDGEGLVVLNMDTAVEFPPESFANYSTARTAFEDLRKSAAELPEVDRRMYYDQLCHSTLAFIAWREHGLSFQSRLRDFLHGPAEPVSLPEIASLRSQLHAPLVRLGYPGDVASQCAAWEEHNRVEPGDVSAVLEDLLAQAWDRTEAHLIAIPAAKADGMRVATLSGAPFNARCNYPARTIELNVDPVITRPALKHLAVHEGYPGHYLQFKLRETMFRQGRATADVLLSVVNSASSSVFEGMADAGMRMIDWIENDNDRVQALLNRHRAAIGTVAAWRLHAESWPVDRVHDWLRAESLAGGEGWVANRMRFLSAPSRAVLIWSYWWGQPAVDAAWDRVAPERRGEFIAFLYGRMHSTRTAGMFDA
jgi:hypothetical protein